MKQCDLCGHEYDPVYNGSHCPSCGNDACEREFNARDLAVIEDEEDIPLPEELE